MRTLRINRSCSKPYHFEAPFVSQAYALLLYIAADDVSVEEQAEISREIVKSGCRYVVCYGHRCSSWDDSIDWASIDAGKDETGFVMTTWHEDDTPEDVASFFWQNTSFHDFAAELMGVFIVGSNPKVEAALEIACSQFHANA